MAEDIGNWERTHYSKEVSPDEQGEIILMGWARAIRGGGNLKFIQLADREGSVQLLAKKGNVSDEVMKEVEELNREDVIAVKGIVKKNEQAPGGFEIIPSEIKVLSKAEPIPMEVITKKTPADLHTRLDNRFIDLRKPEIMAIFKIKSEITRAVREFLRNEGFIEMQTPKLVEMGAEGGATLFSIDYFGKIAYLAQSQQFYKQLMQIAGFDKVFEISPSFRAEKSHTNRHLTEFSHIDVEMSFINGLEDVLKIEEGLVNHTIKSVQKNCKKELEILGKEVQELKLPLPRIAYLDAIKMLQQSGSKIKEGEDIGSENEKTLGDLVKKQFGSDAYFLHKFPADLEVCKFYTMKDDKYGKVADMEYRGQELSTGTQREHRVDVLRKQIKEKGLNEKDFEYYIEPFRYGVPPHGGFGMGLDRLTQFILDIHNIREVVLFPRDPERLTP